MAEGSFVGEAFPAGKEASQILLTGDMKGGLRVGQGMWVEADVDHLHAAGVDFVFGKEEAQFGELEGEGGPGVDDMLRVVVAVVFSQEACGEVDGEYGVARGVEVADQCCGDAFQGAGEAGAVEAEVERPAGTVRRRRAPR